MPLKRNKTNLERNEMSGFTVTFIWAVLYLYSNCNEIIIINRLLTLRLYRHDSPASSFTGRKMSIGTFFRLSLYLATHLFSIFLSKFNIDSML